MPHHRTQHGYPPVCYPVAQPHSFNKKRNAEQENFLNGKKVHVDRRKQYEQDTSCGEHASLKLAYAEMASRYGGYDQKNRKLLLQDGQSQGSVSISGEKVPCETKNYACREDGCQMRCQIVQHKPEGRAQYFQVYRHKYKNTHSHDAPTTASKPEAVVGIDPDVDAIVDAHIASKGGNGKNILSLRPKPVLMHLVNVCRNDSGHAQLRHNLRHSEYCDKVHVQIKGILERRQIAFVQSKLGGHSKIPNNDTLLRAISLFKLTIPGKYRKHKDYLSPQDIADALGVEKDDHQFIIDLTHGRVYNAYKNSLSQRQSVIKDFVTKMEQSFMVISPTGLFQLLTLCKRREGTRVVCADGSCGFSVSGSTVVTIGTPAVCYRRDTKPGVRSSLRTIAYVHMGGERQHPYGLSLYQLDDIAFELFGVHLDIDWGCSDNTDVFMTPIRHYRMNPARCRLPTSMSNPPTVTCSLRESSIVNSSLNWSATTTADGKIDSRELRRLCGVFVPFTA